MAAPSQRRRPPRLEAPGRESADCRQSALADETACLDAEAVEAELQRRERVHDHLDLAGRQPPATDPTPTNVDGARRLVHQSLEKRPGHEVFHDFAGEIGAPLPPRAQQTARGAVVGRLGGDALTSDAGSRSI